MSWKKNQVDTGVIRPGSLRPAARKSVALPFYIKTRQQTNISNGCFVGKGKKPSPELRGCLLTGLVPIGDKAKSIDDISNFTNNRVFFGCFQTGDFEWRSNFTGFEKNTHVLGLYLKTGLPKFADNLKAFYDAIVDLRSRVARARIKFPFDFNGCEKLMVDLEPCLRVFGNGVIYPLTSQDDE